MLAGPVPLAANGLLHASRQAAKQAAFCVYKPKELMEHGLAQWYEEMQKQGLGEKGPNAMEDFILRGVRSSSPPSEADETV